MHLYMTANSGGCKVIGKQSYFIDGTMACLNSLILFNKLDSLFKEHSYVRHHLTTEVVLPSRVKRNYIKYYLCY